MKPKWVLLLFFAILSIASLSILLVIYYYLPIEEVITRQFLFGIVFQIWGIFATVLLVRKILEIRDTRRWESVNKHVFAFLYLKLWDVLYDIFEIFGVKIDVKEKPSVIRFGVEHLNPEHYSSWKKELEKELTNY